MGILEWILDSLRKYVSYRPNPQSVSFFVLACLAVGCMYHLGKVDLKDEQIKTVTVQRDADRETLELVSKNLVDLSRSIGNNVLETPTKLDEAVRTIRSATNGACLRYQQRSDLQGGIDGVRGGANDVREVVKMYTELAQKGALNR